MCFENILRKLKQLIMGRKQTKDSLAVIVKIMEWLHERNGTTQEELEKEFTPTGFAMFFKYCMGTGEKEDYAYAIIKGGENYEIVHPKTEGCSYLLSQDGYRKLHELRRILAEEKRNKINSTFTFAIVVVTFYQTLFLFLSILAAYANLGANSANLANVNLVTATNILSGGLIAIILIGGYYIWRN